VSIDVPLDTPWRDRDRLGPLLAAWAGRVVGRPLFRATAGQGWCALNLEGDDRASLLLTALPGAVVAAPFTAPLPAPLRADLSPTRGDPFTDLLQGGALTALHLLADDLVLEARLQTPRGDLRLRHQLFGQRGGAVILDAGDRMVWTMHPGPHPCLVAPDAAAAPPSNPASDDALAAWTPAGLHRVARQRETALADRLQRALDRRHASASRLADNLARDLVRADDGDARRRDAEALAAVLHTVSRGMEQITVTDPRDGAERVIDLDPALAPHANLERLFKLARKARRGRDVIAGRLDDAQADLAALDDAAASLAPLAMGPPADHDDNVDEALTRLAALRAFATAHPDLLAGGTSGPARAGRAPDEPARPFRRYLIDGRWEVWVGRSSEENDDLTHRASHPADLWLHAQAVAGSHVILRTGGRPDTVPRAVLEKAAALAALHSKARHSSLAPVIWTERRYVRRPRKSPAGTAVCLREQNLFVEPGVMGGVEPA
jgi:hypothetical protein